MSSSTSSKKGKVSFNSLAELEILNDVKNNTSNSAINQPKEHEREKAVKQNLTTNAEKVVNEEKQLKSLPAYVPTSTKSAETPRPTKIKITPVSQETENHEDYFKPLTNEEKEKIIDSVCKDAFLSVFNSTGEKLINRNAQNSIINRINDAIDIEAAHIAKQKLQSFHYQLTKKISIVKFKLSSSQTMGAAKHRLSIELSTLERIFDIYKDLVE